MTGQARVSRGWAQRYNLKILLRPHRQRRPHNFSNCAPACATFSPPIRGITLWTLTFHKVSYGVPMSTVRVANGLLREFPLKNKSKFYSVLMPFDIVGALHHVYLSFVQQIGSPVT